MAPVFPNLAKLARRSPVGQFSVRRGNTVFDARPDDVFNDDMAAKVFSGNSLSAQLIPIALQKDMFGQ